MIEFLRTLTTILRVIHSETYHDRNTKDKIVYPYATFDFDSEAIERNQEGFYLDIDVFDSNASYMRLFELETAFKDGLTFRRELIDEVNLIFSFLGSNKVPTNDENLKRRNIRFYVKVDWRNK